MPAARTSPHARQSVTTEPRRQLIAKYDPVERDRRNRPRGRAGEEFVVEHERRQLAGIGRQDLCRRVRWIDSGRGGRWRRLRRAALRPHRHRSAHRSEDDKRIGARCSSSQGTKSRYRNSGRRIGGSTACAYSPRRQESLPWPCLSMACRICGRNCGTLRSEPCLGGTINHFKARCAS